MPTPRRPVAVLIILAILWPSLTFGQATKAGVVSTLQGTVTATRTAAPQPVPLKFKDDVFLQDRIATGDQSVARILLGGKALVTVRERSVLTITEIPGRSTVNLEAGKIGLAVARERMAPGESVDVRTSNAIAAVRGTVVVAEVSRTTAQAAPGTAPQIVTNIYVLRDPANRGVEVTQIPAGRPTTILPGQGFSIVGAAAGRNVPIPANVTAGLTTQAGAQHSTGSAEATSNVATTQTQQAVVLTNAVLGDPIIITTPAIEGEFLQPPPTEAPSTAEIGVNETQVTETGGGTGGGATTCPPSCPLPFLPDITGAIVDLGGSGIIPPVNEGETLTVPGQLVIVQDATVNNGGELLVVNGGTLTSLEPVDRAFIVVDPSFVDATRLLRVSSGVSSPGVVSLRSPLVEATGTLAQRNHFTFSLDIIQVEATDANALLTSTTARGLVILTHTDVDGSGRFVLLDGGAPTANVASLTLAGPLIVASNVNITLNDANPALEFNFLHLKQGAVVTGTGHGAFAQFDSSTLTLGNALTPAGNNEFLELGAQDTMNLAGGLLAANASTVIVHNSPVVRQIGGTFTTVGDVVALTANSNLTAAEVLNLSGGATMNTHGGAVLAISGGSAATLQRGVTVANSTLDVGGGAVVSVDGGTLTGTSTNAFISADPSSIVAQTLVAIGPIGGAISLAGPVLDAVDVTFTITGDFLSIVNGTLSSTTAQPAVSLLRSDLTLPGRFLDVSGAGAAVSLSGPLLLVTDGNLALATTDAFLRVRNSATVTSTSAQPFVQFVRTVAGANNATFAGGLLDNDTGAISLQGGLLSAGGIVINRAGSGFIRQSGGTFTSAGSELVKLTAGSSLTSAGGFLAVTGGSFTNTGVLLALDGASATVDGAPGIVVAGAGTVLDTGGAYQIVNGGTLTVTNNPAGAMITVPEGTLNATSPATPLVSVTNGTLSADGSVLSVGASGSATLAAEALRATSSTLSFATSSPGLILVEGGTLNANGSSLISLTGITSANLPRAVTVTQGGLLSSAGPAVSVAGSTLGFASDLLSVNGALLQSGGLLSQTGGATTVSGSLLQLFNGANTEITAGQSAITLTGGTLTVTGALLTGGDSVANGSNFLFLSGPLLTATNANINVGAVAVLGPTDGIDAVGVAPLLQLTNSSLTVAAGGVVELEFNPSFPAIQFDGLAAVISGGSVTVADKFLTLGNVTTTNPNPLVQVLGGAVITQTNPAEPFISLRDVTTLGGPLLQVTASQILSFLHLVETSGVVISSGTGSLITADSSVITTTNNLLDVFIGTMSLAGPVLDATDTTFTIAGNFLSVTGGSLSSTTASPAVTLLRSDLTLPFPFLAVSGSAGAVTLAGPLLLMTDSDLSLAAGHAFLDVRNGATVDGASGQPFVQFARTLPGTNTVNLGAELAVVDNGRLTVGGNLFSATGTTVTVPTGHVVRVAAAGSLTTAGHLIALNGATAMNVGDGALLSVGGNAVANVGGALVQFTGAGGNTITVTNSLVPTAFFGGVPFFVAPGAAASIGVSGTALVGLNTLGTITINGTPLPVGADFGSVTGSLVAILDVGGTVRIGLPAAADAPDLELVDLTLTLPAGQSLKSFSGIVNRTGTSPVIRTSNAIINGAAETSLIVVTPGADVTLAGSLLEAIGSTFTVSGHFFDLGTTSHLTVVSPLMSAVNTDVTVTGGEMFNLQTDSLLVGTGTASLVQFSRTLPGTNTVALGGQFMRLDAGATLQIGGGLLDASDTTLNVAGNFLDAFEATITSSSGTFVRLDRSPLTVQGRFIDLFGDLTTMTVAGPLLQAIDSDLTVGSGFAGEFLRLSGGATFTGTGTGALVQLSRATPGTNTLTLNAELLRLEDSTMTIGGGLLSAAGTDITAVNAPLITQIGGAFTGVGNLVSLTGGTHNLFQLLSLSGGGQFTTNGGLLSANGATINTTLSAVDVSGSSTLTAGSELLSATNSTITVGGALLNIGSNSTASVGSLFSATGSDVRALGNFLQIADGGSVTNTVTSPFVQFVGGSYVGGDAGVPDTGALLRMFSALGQSATSLTLSDGLLSASGGATLEATNGAFVDVRDSAVLTSNAGGSAIPFLSFTGGASATASADFFRFGPGGTDSLGGPGTGVPPIATFSAPLFRAADAGSPVTFSSGGHFISVFDGASVTKNGSAAGVQLLGTAPDRIVLQTIDGNVLFVGTTDTVPPTPTPTLTLSGSLIDAQNARITSGDLVSNVRSTLVITDGGIVTKTDSAPLLNFSAVNLTTGGALLNLRASPDASTPSKLILGASPLLVASNSTIATSSLGFAGVFVGQGAQLTGTGSGALLQLTNSTFTAGGVLVQVDDICSGCGGIHQTSLHSTVTLGGGVFRGADSPLSTGFDALFVRRSDLTAGSATSPVFELVDTVAQTYTFGSGANSGSLLTVTAATGGTNTNASVTLNGQLLVMNDTGGLSLRTFNTTGDFVSILNGGSLVSTTTSPLIVSSDSTYNIGGATTFRNFFNLSGAGGAGGLTPSTAQVNGPLLTSLRDTFTASGAFFRSNSGVANFITFTHANPADANTFMQFSGSVMTLGNVATPGAGNVVEVNDLAGIRYQGTGTFLAADTTGVAAWTADRLLFSDVGTQGPTAANFGLNSSSSNPLFSFTGAPIGTHTFKDSLLDLRAFVVGAESDPDFSGNTSDGEPLRHSGDLVRLTSTSMQVGSAGGGNAIKLDVALFNATAPLLNMTASSLTTPSDFLKLTNQSKLTGNLLPADALVKLDASTLNVLNGVLANVAGGFGGSFMNLTNTTLLSLTNGSTVNISANLNNFDAGALVRVAGGSVYKMTGGSLISFGTGTNTVNINNGSSIVGCSGCSLQNVSFNGSGGALAPVLFKNGAGPGNVQVTAGFNPFPGLGGANTLNIGGGTSALFIVDGGTSKVVLKP